MPASTSDRFRGLGLPWSLTSGVSIETIAQRLVVVGLLERYKQSVPLNKVHPRLIKIFLMTSKSLFTAGCLFAASLGAVQAASFSFSLIGPGISGDISLTYAPNPNTGVLPGTSPNPVDPIGSYIVTGISGTFTDSNLGILNSSITGIVPSNPANPEHDNLLAPRSFGFFLIANGAPNPGGVAPGFSYDNLIYPGGSPQAATDYPFHGGYFDIYGIVFNTDSGKSVNLWSNGDFGGGPVYGVGVTDGVSVLNYSNNVALVPEPAEWPLVAGGLALAVAAIVRRRRSGAR